MATTTLKEFKYEPIKVHNKKVVQDYNDFMLNYDYDVLAITDADELAAVEKKLEGFHYSEPDYMEPIISLLGIYEINQEQKEYDELLEHAYKSALRHVTDKDGNWYEVIEWGWLENRSIIRALQNGATKRWQERNIVEAKKVFQNLLKANPGDNSGVRYQLLAILEGMTAKEFDKKMGDTGFVPPAIRQWFDEKAKLHPEFTESLKRWGNME